MAQNRNIFHFLHSNTNIITRWEKSSWAQWYMGTCYLYLVTLLDAFPSWADIDRNWNRFLLYWLIENFKFAHIIIKLITHYWLSSGSALNPSPSLKLTQCEIPKWLKPNFKQCRTVHQKNLIDMATNSVHNTKDVLFNYFSVSYRLFLHVNQLNMNAINAWPFKISPNDLAIMGLGAYGPQKYPTFPAP